jgi:hypothetical protein
MASSETLHSVPSSRLPLTINVLSVSSVLFCIFYIRWRPIKASDELVGEMPNRRQVDTSKDK